MQVPDAIALVNVEAGPWAKREDRVLHWCCRMNLIHLGWDYWLLIQEVGQVQMRKFAYEALSKEKIRLDKEYEVEIYFNPRGASPGFDDLASDPISWSE